MAGPKKRSQSRDKAIGNIIDDVRRVVDDSWDEVVAGIRSSQAGGSISLTIQFERGKRDMIKIALKPRVRVPRDAIHYEAHLDDQGELALGAPPGWEGPDGAEE